MSKAFTKESDDGDDDEDTTANPHVVLLGLPVLPVKGADEKSDG